MSSYTLFAPYDMSKPAYGMGGTLALSVLRPRDAVMQEPEELFETLSQCLLSGVDRDALSGWGGIVYVMCVSPLRAGLFQHADHHLSG